MSITVLTAMSEPPRRFDVFTGTGRRRSYTAAEKAAIVAESYTGEDSVCGVARRHSLSSSQLFTWHRLAQPRLSHEATEPPLFVPAIMASKPEVSPRGDPSTGSKPYKRRRRNQGAGIELEIDGVVVRVGREADAGAIAAL